MGAKESYEKGYAAGRACVAEGGNKGTLGNEIHNVIFGNSYYKPDGTEAYKEGFKQGEKDEYKK